MSAPALLWHLLRERCTGTLPPREPEDEAIMLAATSTAAFRDAGRSDGVLAFLYLYHALQASDVIVAGDRVLDLACGPANQLVVLARLTPQARFVGLDASPAMLEEARATLAHAGVHNVELMQGDMTRLAGLADGSFDVVVCTMSLHHLRDRPALERAAGEMARVRRAGGGWYLADFARLKRAQTQRYFARDWEQEQAPAFTEDFYRSMRAAFSVEELRAAGARLDPAAALRSTALAPFMVVLRGPARRSWDGALQARARALHGALDARQQRRFQVFARWLAAGQCPLPFDPAA